MSHEPRAVRQIIKTNRTRLLVFGFVLAVLSSLLSAPCFAKDYHYKSWDVDVVVNTDSTLNITETHHEVITGEWFGRYRDLMYGDNILGFSDVSVSEGDTPYTLGYVVKGGSNTPGLFSGTDYQYSGGYYEILYSIHAKDEKKTFTLKYKVNGGIYYYDTADKLEWKAISETRDQRIDRVNVTVHLPKDITLKSGDIGLTADGDAQTMKQTDKKTVKFSGQNLGANTKFWVGVRFPKGYVTVNPALLKLEKDVAARQVKERWALIISLGFSIMLVIIVFLVMLLVWFRWGRDAKIPFTASYLTEPPDNTPPAVVSEVVFETTDIQDINATLIDLARRGYLKFWSMPDDTTFEWLGDKGDMRLYEKQLVGDLFVGQQTALLSTFKDKFYSKTGRIYKLMGQEAVALGYYKTAPAEIKKRFSGAGLAVMLLGGGLTCCASGTISDQFIGTAENIKNLIAFSPPVAMVAAGLIILIFGMLMPRKTAAGAEAHSRWWAFRNYLANIQKYGKVGNAQEIYEKYMPYAVSFKLEKVFTEAFTAQEVIPPIWFAPYWYPGYPGQTISGGGAAPATFDLNQMNDSLTSTLNDVATTLTSQPSSSGGGGGFSGGGGGFSGGGGGGGGSGGW